MKPSVIVEADADPRVLIITINRPEARNAVNGDVARLLADAMDRLDTDPVLRVGILQGAGGGFSAGMDLKAFAAGEDVTAYGRGFGGLTQRPPAKPLIAAVEGFAVGGGLELALACDLLVVGAHTKLGLPEVKHSLLAAGGGLLRLAQSIPYALAAEIALTGDTISAERLYQAGLLNRVTSPGDAFNVAQELAYRIADNAPLAVAASKTILQHAGDWGLAQGWHNQQEIALGVMRSNDAREGTAAFAERRAPSWQGN